MKGRGKGRGKGQEEKLKAGKTPLLRGWGLGGGTKQK